MGGTGRGNRVTIAFSTAHGSGELEFNLAGKLVRSHI